MKTSFSYSAESVQKAEGGNYINRTGEYLCTISQVSTYETKSGAQMVRFVLKEDATAALCQTDLCVISKAGEETFGKGIFDSTQKILGLSSVEATKGKVHNIFDRTAEDGYRFTSLEKKRIGVVLQRENYTKQDGKMGHRMNIVCFFDPQTRKTASELERGAEARKVDSFKTLQDKERKESSAPAATMASASQPADLNEDVPF